MNLLALLKLCILEQRLKLAAFGKYNRYRCWCIERKATTITEKLRLAQQVLDSPGVSLIESWHNINVIRNHR